MCGCRPHWVQVEGSNIPAQAVPAGEASDGGKYFAVYIKVKPKSAIQIIFLPM